MTAALLLISSCSDDDDVIQPGSQTEDQQAAAASYAEECNWFEHSSIDDEMVRGNFVAGETSGGGARLFLETDEVRAGEGIQVAVASDSSEPVDYGTFNDIEDPSGAEIKLEPGQLFLAIGLRAGPGEVGQCIGVSVPPDTQPGDYAVVVDDVQVGDGPEEDLKAPFRVTE